MSLSELFSLFRKKKYAAPELPSSAKNNEDINDEIHSSIDTEPKKDLFIIPFEKIDFIGLNLTEKREAGFKSLIMFLTDKVSYDYDSIVSYAEFESAYKSYCENHNLYALNRAIFSKALKMVCLDIEKVRQDDGSIIFKHAKIK